MTLNQHDDELLAQLRLRKHLKANPGDARVILLSRWPELDETEVLASFRRVTGDGLAKRVTDPARADALLLRLTDEGMAQADHHIEATRDRTLKEKLQSVDRSEWIALAAFLVSVIALFRGQ